MAKKPFVPVVAVLNMKGGVGKTTLSANVFRRLYYEKEISTLLLDLDPQFNLTQSLFKRDDYEDRKSKFKTLASVLDHSTKSSLLEISSSHQDLPKVDDIARMFWHINKSNPRIHLDAVPGDFDLVKYSLMDDNKKLGVVKNRFISFIESSKDKYGLIVLDCNPSSSFLTVCALTVCTHVLVPVKLDKYSVLGLEMLWEFVNERLPIAPKPEFIILINGLKRSNPGNAALEMEAELRGHAIFGARTLANSVRETAQLKARTDYTGFSVDRRTSVSGSVRTELNKVAEELGSKLGLK